MLQTLFYIPRQIAGVPVFGVGWLLGAWAVVSIVWLGWIVRRHGWSPEVTGNLPLLATLGAVIAWVLPQLCEPQGLPIRGYGVMLLLGLASGVGLAAYRARQIGVNSDLIYSLAFWMCISGIVGARVFYVIEYWPEYQRPTFWQTIEAMANFTKGGLVVFGSAIGAGLALWAFVRKYRLPGLALADLIAPSVMLGLAFGRVGCFFNGCCFGGQCDRPWAVQFPFKSPPHVRQIESGKMSLHGLKITGEPDDPAVIEAVEPNSPAARAGLERGQHVVDVLVNGKRMVAETSGGTGCRRVTDSPKYSPADTVGEVQLALLAAEHGGEQLTVYTRERAEPAVFKAAPPVRSLPIHPAQLYSALDALLLCLFLLAYNPYRQRDGEVFAWMITLHPISRFLQEVIRIDESSVFGTGLSISQNLSILMLVAALGLWWHLLGRPKELAWPGQAVRGL
ncbi:MAG TPA: prolipoprotein diacylglyceryl transferase family protein [Pirellulales bacterium]|nr:prolipoprotein diacylglyceryl transferase family protein [Pirellulales bacterium]